MAVYGLSSTFGPPMRPRHHHLYRPERRLAHDLLSVDGHDGRSVDPPCHHCVEKETRHTTILQKKTKRARQQMKKEISALPSQQ